MTTWESWAGDSGGLNLEPCTCVASVLALNYKPLSWTCDSSQELRLRSFTKIAIWRWQRLNPGPWCCAIIVLSHNLRTFDVIMSHVVTLSTSVLTALMGNSFSGPQTAVFHMILYSLTSNRLCLELNLGLIACWARAGVIKRLECQARSKDDLSSKPFSTLKLIKWFWTSH